MRQTWLHRNDQNQLHRPVQVAKCPFLFLFCASLQISLNMARADRTVEVHAVNLKENYAGKRPQTVSSWNSKEQGGKDLKSSVAASWQGQSDPSSEKKRYQVRFCKVPL